MSFVRRGGGGGGGAGATRGGRGEARGGRGGGGRRVGGRGRGAGDRQPAERPKREAILDLIKFQDEQIRVKFAGGREIVGILKGYDQLMNLVLDEVSEILHDAEGRATDQSRELGLVVARGPVLLLISPQGEEIENPFTTGGNANE